MPPVTFKAICTRPDNGDGSPDNGRYPTIAVRDFRGDSQDWDSFCFACEGSFRNTFGSIRASKLEHYLFRKLYLFDICVPSEGNKKIGQCAIGVGREAAVFIDAIQLLRAFQHYWPAAMATILETLGPGDYHYGSEWSIEAPREHELARVPGVEIRHVEARTVDAVDFSSWASWDDYYTKTSSNVRRNVKRAKHFYPDLKINVRQQGKVLLDVKDVIRLRLAVYRRKGIERSPIVLGLRYITKMIYQNKHAVTATVSNKGQVLSVFSGIVCGTHMYYLEGGSQPNNNGASWSLLVHMLRFTYEKLGPNAKFIFGPGLTSGPKWSDLVRSREQCRYTSHPTSVVKFCFKR